MKYFDLKNEYHHQIADKKLGQKNINIVNIAGVPLEIWRSKAFKNAEWFVVSIFSKFSKNLEHHISRDIPAMVMILLCFFSLLFGTFLWLYLCFKVCTISFERPEASPERLQSQCNYWPFIT